MKWRGRMPHVTKYLAHRQIFRTGTRFCYANLEDCSHRQIVKGPKIADESGTGIGLALKARRRAFRPCTLTGTRPFFEGGFLRPLERGLDRLAAVRVTRLQWTATIQGIRRLLGWRRHVGKPNRRKAQHRS